MPDIRLSQFILDNLEAILQQWEDFARSLKSGHALSIQALRDDAERMLRFVAADMESAQTRQEEIDKATGHGTELPSGELSAAHDHGVGRAVERFSLVELVSEYRALRASVTRMWIDAIPVSRESVAQIIRFDEAIDQILAEAVWKFSERIDRDADLFTASVGHDLSNPVSTVSMAARVIATREQLSASGRDAVLRIERAASRLTGMLVDLRDFTRTRLGGLVRIDREACDVGTLVRNIVDELASVYASRHISLDCEDDLVAHVDGGRVAQLVSNLVANALQHGPATAEVTVSVRRDADAVSIEVHNTGSAIDAERMKTLFDPLSRTARSDDDARLGLGLYIAQQIALAHGGSINVQSSEQTGTRFIARLPREQKSAPGDETVG